MTDVRSDAFRARAQQVRGGASAHAVAGGGNFPQAVSHIGVIASGVTLAKAAKGAFT
jgi:hypothetical protein